MGELSRKNKKDFDDSEIISLIKKLINTEKEVLSILEKETSEYLKVLESFIPEQVSEDEILEWIKNNIDFSGFKNKMQAMGPITKHFGTTADGNVIKTILINNF